MPTCDECYHFEVLLADHIIIADQSDSNQVLEVAGKYEKVLIVRNPDKDYDEGSRVRLLVETARQQFGLTVLLSLDADETLSSNVLHSSAWQHFVTNGLPGTAGSFTWVTLWDGSNQYITKGYGAPQQNTIAFIDDGRDSFRDGAMHATRGIGLHDPDQTIVFHDVALLHYMAADLRRFISKQNWYKCWWVNHGSRRYHALRNHNWYHIVKADQIQPVRRELVCEFYCFRT